MAKIDKTKYTKKEWLELREKRRREKLQKKTQQLVNLTNEENNTNFILCLKHGRKYSSEYVNKLYRGVSRHCTLPFKFYCLTDDSLGLDSNIHTIPLPDYLKGWWCKPYMFSNDLPIKGNILYLDLDVVIAGNIDKLFTYQPDNWCTVRDFTRAMRPKWHKYNSSIVRFKTGQLGFIWEEYKQNYENIQRKFFGDQDFLWDVTKDYQAMLYPDSWIQSWKWEVRQDKEWAPGGVKGTRTFKKIENVEPRIECCVAVFHGDPNPEHCKDPWVVDNWI